VEKPKSRMYRIPFRNFDGRRASKGFGGVEFELIAERILA